MRAALIVVALAGTAAARPTIVSARLDGDLAHIVVRQPIARTDRGPTLEMVEIPDDGLVIGARVDGHTLALVSPSEADAGFAALVGDGPQRAPAWGARIVRGDRHSVAVSIAAPGAGFAELELEVVAPTCYARDARFAMVPEAWAPESDGGCGAGHWLKLPDTALAQRHGLDRLGTHADRAALDELHVARLEIELPAKFGEVPADLATVILVDLSRSVGEKRFAEETALVLDYLRRAPATRVQLIGFARHPFALVPGWRIASQALPLVERVLATTPLRNGSNLDAALVEAQAALDLVPGTHRIVVLSDELLPGRIRADQLRAVLAPDVLVNAVLVEPAATLVRDDDGGALAPLAAATYGVHMRGGTTAEQVLRPTTLDHLVVRASGWLALAPSTCPDDLVEGAGCTAWFQGPASATAITVEGLAWGRKVSRAIAPDLSRGLDVARELSGKQLLEGDPHAAIADQLARGVNGAWSLFARWGGTGGYATEQGGFGSTGGGSSSGGILDRFGTLGHGGVPRLVDKVESQLAPAVAACHAERDRVVVQLELTFEETVDVEVAGLGSDLDAQRRRACLIDAIWDIDLAIDTPVEHTTMTVTLD